MKVDDPRYAWRLRNRERWLAIQRESYARNRAKRRASALLARYGMTADELVRMWTEQGGLCAACGVDVATDFVVDHDHATGRVRGLLCSADNKAIGFCQDSPARLRAVALYLEGAE